MSEVEDNVQEVPWLSKLRALAEELGEGSIDKSGCLVRIAAIAKEHNVDRGLAKTVFNEEMKNLKAKNSQETQDDTLLRLAEEAELFHTPDGIAYGDVIVDGHRKTYPVKSTDMRRWLINKFRAETGQAPSTNAMKAAIDTIEAKACVEGSEIPVYLRVGSAGGKIYLDLANPAGQAVEIDAAGRQVIKNPPVRFRRTKNMRPLPVPQTGGSVEDLKHYVHFATKADLILTVLWLVAALRDRGPYPILKLGGEPGASKTTAARILRKLIDPSASPLRSVPKDERDLFIAAKSNHVVAVDNISTVSPWLSDALCRLSTGGGYGTRSLYTDDEEATCDAIRPLILTGIDECITRGDLADRIINSGLAQIDAAKRRTEEDLYTAFDSAHPKLLGALLDLVSHGIKMLPTTRPARLPRMADFAVWAAACGSKLWPSELILGIYERKREEVDAAVIEDDAALRTLQKFMATRGTWTGKTETLLTDLTAIAGAAALSNRWPPIGRSLSNRMRKAATSLRQLGIDVEFGRHAKTGTPITITNTMYDQPTRGSLGTTETKKHISAKSIVTQTPSIVTSSPLSSPAGEAQTEGLCGSHERDDDGDDRSPPFLKEKEKIEEKIILYRDQEVGGSIVTPSPSSPTIDNASNINGLTGDDTGGDSGHASSPASSASSPTPAAEDWRAYQQERLAHWQSRCSPDETARRAWQELQTRWAWIRYAGHPLDPAYDRDVATRELLALGLTPSGSV